MGLNGDKTLPALQVTWDQEKQKFLLEPPDFTEWKDWLFIRAALEAAVNQAEFQLNLVRMQSLQMQAMEQAQGQAIRSKIMRG